MCRTVTVCHGHMMFQDIALTLLRAGHMPVAMGSLELDTDETDVNAVSSTNVVALPLDFLSSTGKRWLTNAVDLVQLLASIFTQLGGQGGMPGFVAGEGANEAGRVTVALLCLGLWVCSKHWLNFLSHADGHEHQRVGEEAQFIAQQVSNCDMAACSMSVLW